VSVVNYLLNRDEISGGELSLTCSNACTKGSLKILKLIVSKLDLKAFPDSFNSSVADAGIFKFFLELEEKGLISVNTVIRAASHIGDIDTLEKKNSGLRSYFDLVASIAVGANRTDVFYFAGNRGANPFISDLDEAASSGNYGLFKYVLENATGPLKSDVSSYEYISKNLIQLSQTDNEKIFDYVYNARKEQHDDVIYMIIGAIRMKNVRNFKKALYGDGVDWWNDKSSHRRLSLILKEKDIHAIYLTDEMFDVLLPFFTDKETEAIMCLKNQDPVRFRKILKIKKSISSQNVRDFIKAAASYGYLKIVKRMIKLGASTTAMVRAFERSKTLAIAKFLEARLKNRLKESNYLRLFLYSLAYTRIGVADHYFPMIAHMISTESAMPVENVMNREVARYLLEKGANPNFVLRQSIKARNIRAVKLVIEGYGATNLEEAYQLLSKSEDHIERYLATLIS
jgi:hypothetical protein